MDKHACIATISLFQGLEDIYLKHLADIALQKPFKRGEIIFIDDDPCDGFYVAATGRIKIFKISPEGKEQILHIFDPGEPFGEVPVFTGQNFPAYAEALSDTLTLFFPRDSFIGLIKQDPSLALNMLSVLSMRLKRFTVLIEDLSLKEVPGRLAAYLLYLSERNSGTNELHLDISKTQLASILGTIPETLSRILARMGREGFLTTRGKSLITIDDRLGMEKLATGETRLG